MPLLIINYLQRCFAHPLEISHSQQDSHSGEQGHLGVVGNPSKVMSIQLVPGYSPLRHIAGRWS